MNVSSIRQSMPSAPAKDFDGDGAGDGEDDGEDDGGGGTSAPVRRAPGVCRRRLGVAAGAPVSAPFRAMSRSSLSALVRLNAFFSSRSARTPETCGALMDVPLIVRVALRPVIDAERIFSPGAAMSTHRPVFEKKANWSPVVLAATVTTPVFSACPPAAAGEV